MGRLAVFVYGIVSYLIFFGTFVYLIGFGANLVVPKSIDSGETGPVAQAVLVNVILLGLFALQHTVMARQSFKRWLTRFVPQAAERSTFVLVASLLLLLTAWQWRPIPEEFWSVRSPVGRGLLTALSFFGWGMVLYTTTLIDHFDLFGLRQAYLHLRGREYTPVEFQMVSLYKWVRHPLMLGFIIAFWATPDMTVGHLLFAIVTTAYIFVGIHFEERSLVAAHGDGYRAYRGTVSMIVPMPRRQKEAVLPAGAGSET